MPTREAIESALEQFTGTERYYPHMGKLLLTDGAKFLADQAQCYWLYDIVWSALPRLLHDSFGMVKLTMDLAKKAAGSSSRMVTTTSIGQSNQ